jgi:hypothetical protein
VRTEHDLERVPIAAACDDGRERTDSQLLESGTVASGDPATPRPEPLRVNPVLRREPAQQHP